MRRLNIGLRNWPISQPCAPCSSTPSSPAAATLDADVTKPATMLSMSACAMATLRSPSGATIADGAHTGPQSSRLSVDESASPGA